MTEHINIRVAGEQETLPFELLLLADPSEHMISLYLGQSTVFIAEAGEVVAGVCVLYPEIEDTAEIKNIAVKEDYQGKGIGRQLLNYTIGHAKQSGYQHLLIGTADCGAMQIRLYESVGFVLSGVKKNFFTDNYPEPLYENGVLIKDMVMLSMSV